MFLYENEYIRVVPGNPQDIRTDLADGLYTLDIEATMHGKNLKLKKKDDYLKGIVVKGGPFDKIRNDAASFLSNAQTQARLELGMMHKVGFLLKGSPGTGKTYLACQLAAEIARDHGAIAMVTSDIDLLDPGDIIDQIRSTLDDPNKLIIIIMDEFEKSRAKWSSDMHAFLDGTASRDNIIVMATVNDISELPNSYTNRPGRFEKTYDFSITDNVVLQSIVNQTLPEKYHSIFNIKQIVSSLTSGKTKFGLSGNDEISIDKIRIMLRNKIADYINSGNVSSTTSLKEITVPKVNTADKDTEEIVNLLHKAAKGEDILEKKSVYDN